MAGSASCGFLWAFEFMGLVCIVFFWGLELVHFVLGLFLDVVVHFALVCVGLVCSLRC